MWYDPTLGAVVGPRVPGQFGYTQFDAQGNPFPLQVPAQYSVFLAEDAYEPEIGPDGQADWHAIWKNELRRLRHATIEQMRAGATPDWYKMMAETVRAAFNPQPAEAAQEGMHSGEGSAGAVQGTTENGIEHTEGQDAEALNHHALLS